MKTSRDPLRTLRGHARLAIRLALFGASLAGAAAQAQTITDFPLPAGGGPQGIAAGPDGNLWFTEETGNRIGRITPEGVITEFPLPNSDSHPGAIVAGLDGSLWFTESSDSVFGSGRRIGRITTSGEITEFPIGGGPSGLSSVADIAAGPDGNLWFTVGGRVKRMTPAGAFTDFQTSEAPFGIAAGSDGNIWFTEYGFTATDALVAKIGRITMAGALTEFPIPNATGQYGYPGSITTGPDGNLWFIESGGVIGQITTAGVLTEFPIEAHLSLSDIVTGPDGNLWLGSDQILRMTTAGVVSSFVIPRHPSSLPFRPRAVAIAAGPDGNLWFTESEVPGGAGRIGRITTTCAPDSRTLCLSGGRFLATATYANGHVSGSATASGLSDSSGFFTFENPDSVELVVKVLDACSLTPSRFWVFAAGLTNQGTTVTVTDTKTGERRSYSNPVGETFVTVTDTSAFSACP